MIIDLIVRIVYGMGAITHLRERKQTSQVIFITSYQEYAIQAFDVDAVHYLLKPVSDENLYRLWTKR